MKKYISKIISLVGVFILVLTFNPNFAFAAGTSVSGGGTFTAGQSFSVRVTASGATFNAFQGTITVSGPVSVTSVSYDTSALWIAPPSIGKSFYGALQGKTATSFTLATIGLKGTSAGSGSVSVSGVNLANAGSSVGTSGGSSSFTIKKAPVVPGAVTVTSTTHPDQNTAYEATSVALAWEKASGVTSFAYTFDEVADTNPSQESQDVSKTYDNVAVGVHYFHIKAKNGGHAWFPFQKTVMPILPLILWSIFFYFITRK